MSDLFCFYCSKPATKLCDGKTETGTCDRPMCDNCVAQQGSVIVCKRGRKNKQNRGFADTVDYCQECAAKRSVTSLVEEIFGRVEGAKDA